MTLLGVPAGAQSPPPATACSFDTLAQSRPVEVTYSLLPPAMVVADSLARDIVRTYSLAIADHFVAPTVLALDDWPVSLTAVGSRVFQDDRMNDFGLGGELLFQLDSTGHLLLPPTASTNAPALNRAIIDALKAANAAGELAPTPASSAFPEGRVTLRVHASRVVPATAVPLMRAQVRALMIDTPAEYLKRPPLAYPKVRVGRPIETAVTLSFVVAATGRIVPSSIRVEEAEYREFIEAAVTALLKARFIPARSGSCPVPMRLSLRMRFHGN